MRDLYKHTHLSVTSVSRRSRGFSYRALLLDAAPPPPRRAASADSATSCVEHVRCDGASSTELGMYGTVHASNVYGDPSF